MAVSLGSVLHARVRVEQSRMWVKFKFRGYGKYIYVCFVVYGAASVVSRRCGLYASGLPVAVLNSTDDRMHDESAQFRGGMHALAGKHCLYVAKVLHVCFSVGMQHEHGVL